MESSHLVLIAFHHSNDQLDLQRHENIKVTIMGYPQQHHDNGLPTSKCNYMFF